MTVTGHPARPFETIPAERSPRERRRRRIIGSLSLVGGALLLLIVLGLLKFFQISTLINAGTEMQKAGPPPETVSTRRAETQTWERTLSAVASVVSARGVALASEVPGVVTALRFDSGQEVEQGEVLMELDSRVERAQLAAVNARLELARTSLARSESLVQRGVVAQSQLEADQASFKSLTAERAGLEAQIQRKILRAPFAGKLGLRQVNLGQFLSPGTVVAVLESPTADFVDFTLPQDTLGVVHAGMKVRAGEPGVTETPLEGEISAVDPTIDPVTRSIKVRARFPQKDSPLRPGMFLRASLVLPERRSVVAIPATSVVHASYGDSVFVVESKSNEAGKEQLVARQKFVDLGDARGDFVEVERGLLANEEVVTAGAFKLRNGMPIRIDNQSVKLDPKLEPRPENR
jgi:membrane fusion protein (multidrug efflux system)